MVVYDGTPIAGTLFASRLADCFVKATLQWIEFTLAAIAQNLRRMAKLITPMPAIQA